jgi:hypothetical protein
VKKLMILTSLITIWLAIPASALAYETVHGIPQFENTVSEQEKPAALYTSSEGIQFISFSSMWNEAKLKGLYETLLKCGHGEELGQLKKVILSPDTSTGKSGLRVGNYNEETKTIRLYEVESGPVERVLIHEYGHHFSYYWLQNKERSNPEMLTELSEWSKIRQLQGYPIRWFGSKLSYIHKWDPNEILAEDYVLLFGVGGVTMPDDPEGTINLLRHENEYIPSAQSIPELRRYWEKLAGLTKVEPMQIPAIQQWEVADSTRTAYRLTVSSAAAAEHQHIKYGIRVKAYDEQGGMPIIWTTSLSSRGQSSIETKLDLTSIQQNQKSFRLNIQIWASDPESKQLVYTPMYGNWFAYDGITRSLTAISPPIETFGMKSMLKNEGMDKWPLVHLFLNGKQLKMVHRQEDLEGNLYVPLRLFNAGKEKAQPARDPMLGNGEFELTAQFNQRKVELQTDQTHAFVNDTHIKLAQKMLLVGSEALVSIQDLPQLFGIRTRWDETGSSLFIETY